MRNLLHFLAAFTLVLALSACGGRADGATVPGSSGATEIASLPAPRPGEGTPVRHFTLQEGSAQASYAVREELFGQNVGSRITVGGTDQIEGRMALRIDPTSGGVELGENLITVNLESLTSNESRRDNRIRSEWLDSSRYPIATFVAREISGFPTGAREGQAISFLLSGDLTIRDVTRAATFNTFATLNADMIIGTASTVLYMRDFGFDPPSVMGVLAVTDGATVTLEFTLREE